MKNSYYLSFYEKNNSIVILLWNNKIDNINSRKNNSIN